MEKKLEHIINVQSLQSTTRSFKALGVNDLLRILDLTIKRDSDNKLIAFLCALSAYTEKSQFNILFSAPSSSGKTFIPLEIAKLFPPEDVIQLAQCSPQAFFHDTDFDQIRGVHIKDLERKIIIFTDQPQTTVLERLRSLLSHDHKEIEAKIANSSSKTGLKTKTIILRGFPSVMFCTAGCRIDEQEATRCILLSPEINQSKLIDSISSSVLREADSETFENNLENNKERTHLKERIRAIRAEHVGDIVVRNPERILKVFLANHKQLKPRHNRDVKRLFSLIKAFALLNVWYRERKGTKIFANDSDIQQGLRLWTTISIYQEFNLPPYIYHFCRDVVVDAWREKSNNRRVPEDQPEIGQGLTRDEIRTKHSNIFGSELKEWDLRTHVIPSLINAGLLTTKVDPDDRRHELVFPSQKALELFPSKYSERGDKSPRCTKTDANVSQGIGNAELETKPVPRFGGFRTGMSTSENKAIDPKSRFRNPQETSIKPIESRFERFRNPAGDNVPSDGKKDGQP